MLCQQLFGFLAPMGSNRIQLAGGGFGLRLVFQLKQRINGFASHFAFQPAGSFGHVFAVPKIMAMVAKGGGVVGMKADCPMPTAKMMAALQTCGLRGVACTAMFALIVGAGADVVAKCGIGWAAGKGFKVGFTCVFEGFI